jgi:hypothetical protein
MSHCRVPQTEIHESQLYEELPAFLRGQVATHLLRDILASTGWWEVPNHTCRGMHSHTDVRNTLSFRANMAWWFFEGNAGE